MRVELNNFQQLCYSNGLKIILTIKTFTYLKVGDYKCSSQGCFQLSHLYSNSLQVEFDSFKILAGYNASY